MSIKDWFQDKAKSENEIPDKIPKKDGKVFSFNSRPVLSLDEIALGMQHAAMAANRLIAHQYIQAIEQFFDRDEDGILRPKTVEMVLDSNHRVKLPLVALSTPRGLFLEKMKVFLTVCTESVEPMTISQSCSDETVSRFVVSLSPPHRDNGGRDTDHIDVEMQFTALDPPESVMRLIEEYTRHIHPISSS